MESLRISDQLKDNYDDYYKDGDSEWRRIGAMDKAHNIVSLCGDLPRRSIVEIGAGEGSILKRLSELEFGEALYALEISSSGVEVIRSKNIPRLAECVLFDGYTIPFDDDRFDIAILSHVVEHVEYPRRLLHEASRVARYLFLEVPLEDNFRLPEDFVFDRTGHINYYSPKTIRRLVQSCNLNVLRQITTNPSKDTHVFLSRSKGAIKYYVKQFLLKTAPSLATYCFTYHGSLICEKSTGSAC
jgi:SAM-dependent methyltransferase